MSSASNRLQLTTCAALTALAYFALARFSLLFVVQPERIAGFWLPNGLLIGVLVQRDRRDWVALLASGCAANLLANLSSENSFGLSCGFAIVNGFESWLAAWALVRYIPPPITLNRLKEVFGLVGISAIPACFCGAAFGAALIDLTVPGITFWAVWRVWLVADLLGMLLMTPLVITWHTEGLAAVRRFSLPRAGEFAALLLLLLAVTAVVARQSPNTISSLFIRPYVIVPFLLWAAMRFGAWGASTATLLISVLAVWSAGHGLGPFAKSGASLGLQILAVQTLLIVVVLTTLIMVAIMAERTRFQNQLELVIRGTDAGIWDWNLQTNEIYHSPRWKNMLGFEDHELESTFEVWKSRVHPDDLERAQAIFQDYLAGKLDRYEQEYRLRHKDGSYRWVLSRGLALRDSKGRPTRVAGSNLDITDRKQAEAALRESEKQFSVAFDDSPIGMDLVDLQGRFIRVNAAYCRMVGYSADQLIGRHFREITHPEDVAADEASLQRLVAGELRTYQAEKRYLHADGHVVWALLNVTKVTDELGRPLLLFGQIQDITRLKQTEEELRRQAEELRRSNQELDDFAYIASHDLKAPLRGIENLARWISEDADAALSAASREHLQKLRQRVARLERLLNDLLQYSRAGQMKGEVLEIKTGPLVRSVVELLTVPPGFTVIVDDHLPKLVGYKTPLELVFRNLIDNAIKHHDRNQGRIEVSATPAGRFVEFSVADDGPGIPAEYHERIFRMFQTLKPRDELEGSGIGLAVVKKIVECQGGQVTVESRNGRGTTFRFTWPLFPLPEGGQGASHV